MDGRLIIAGGAQAFSPEPMAEFIDAFVIGDGEEVIHRVVDLVKAGCDMILFTRNPPADVAAVDGAGGDVVSVLIRR